MSSEKDLLLFKMYLLMHKGNFEDETADVNKIDPEVKEEAVPTHIKTALQRKILGAVHQFEKSADEELNKEIKVQEFLKGYERLSLLSKSYTDEEVIDLYNLSKQVNLLKGLGVIENTEFGSNRLDKVIFIDSIAHNLHQIKMDDGRAFYKQLDDLADISKSKGEKWREDRLLILNSPDNINKLEALSKLDIIQKSKLLDKGKSFWRLFEKAIKVGVDKLSDTELIILREWLYSKV